MSSSSWALQEAIFATLTANGAVKDVLGDPPRVFDAVPRASAFPYIVIGEDAETNWDTKTEAGSEHALTVTVWSRAGGRREAKLAGDAVVAALDGAALSLVGHTLVDIRFTASLYQRESDGRTWRGTLKFRAVTEPQ